MNDPLDNYLAGADVDNSPLARRISDNPDMVEYATVRSIGLAHLLWKSGEDAFSMTNDEIDHAKRLAITHEIHDGGIVSRLES